MGQQWIESEIRENWRMLDPVAVAEIELSSLISKVFDVSELTQIPAYPSISRDVAILVSEDVTHEQVMKVIKAAAPKDLTAINLFDIFKGKGVADSNKSLAYSLVYRSSEHTLTDEDANGYHEAIKAALVSELNAEIR
jgi:phenylalanyl-tRNA synthetase beta chain